MNKIQQYLIDNPVSFKRYCHSIVKNHQDVEECIQNILISLMKVNVQDIKDIKAFLYVTIRNQSFNINKSVASSIRTKNSFKMEGPTYYDMANNIEARSSLLKLNDVYLKLPKKRKAAFFKRFLEGSSSNEIASELNIAMNTAKVHFRLAQLEMLKHEL